MNSNLRVAVVGVGRNIENTIEKEYLRYERLLKDFDFVSMYVVESDSFDESGQVLEAMSKKFPKFCYSQMGKLDERYSYRIDRIRLCRNRYIAEIRTESKLRNSDLILVVDLDNINTSLRISKLVKSIKHTNDDWSALFPNQLLNYYDLIALRCRKWLITDFNNLVSRAHSIYILSDKNQGFLYKLRYELIRQKYLSRKCIRIPIKQEPFQVLSAFGGMGIYKTKVLLDCDYGAPEVVPLGECEHVELHRQAAKKGYILYIVPDLLNNLFSQHTFRKSLICRLAISFLRKVGINV